MNREIKFRVWDKENKKLRYLNHSEDTLFVNKSGAAGYENLCNGSGGDDYELMEFVGIKDKNGKEIYEGDLVKFDNDNKHYQIKFGEGMFYAEYTSIPDKNNNVVGKVNYPMSFIDWKDNGDGSSSSYLIIEIVGNIFENLNLLNK
jgi:uncharacterized phage protein (TIGR01671 family)